MLLSLLCHEMPAAFAQVRRKEGKPKAEGEVLTTQHEQWKADEGGVGEQTELRGIKGGERNSSPGWHLNQLLGEDSSARKTQWKARG